MPNAACPQCDAIEAQVQAAGRRVMDLQDRTAPLRAELEAGLQPFADRLSQAMTARLQAEAEHAALVQAAAEMTAEIAKMTGAGAFAVAGFNPADVSRQEQPGWLRVEVGPTVLWFRNAEAHEQYMRASGLASALDGLARLQAQREAALERVRQANDHESTARTALDQAEEQANQRLQQHIDSIAAAEAERERLHRAWNACLDRCRRGVVEDQRVGLVGVALMVMGLTLILIGNPFGIETTNAQEPAPTAAASATGTTTTAVAPPTATPQVSSIGPIRAVFNPPAQTTTYTLPLNVTGGTPRVEWRGADCGAYGAEGPTGFRWNHPHPPCDRTTDHSDRTIVATVQLGSVTVECRYQGSATGTGPACTGPGGSAMTTATPGATAAAGGAAPTSTSTSSPTVTAPAGGSTASATPSVSPTGTSAGGGSTQTRTPTPTSTPAVSEGGDGQGGGANAGAVVAGTALTAAGGAAAGYATSRRRNGDETEEGDETGGDGTAPPPTPPLTGPKITVSGGATTVTNDRPFTITVETPRPASGDPPETIEVKMRSVATGEEETVTLRWNGGVSGNVVYTSHPLTLEHGGTGGGKTTVFGLEFSTGNMGDDLDDTPNGTDIVISTGGTETRVTAYTTWVQEGIGEHMTAIRQYGEFWRNVGMQISGLPDSEGKRELESKVRTALRLVGEASRIEHSDWLHTRKLAYLRAIFGMLRGGVTHDPRDEYQYFSAAEREGREMSESALWRGMAGATIGLYRTVAEVSGAGAAFTLFTGTDIMLNRVGWDQRLFAALDLAGRLTIFPGTRMAIGGALDRMAMGEVRAVATEARAVTNAAEAEARAAEAARDAAASTAYAERQAANRLATAERRAASPRVTDLIPDRPNPGALSGRGLLGAPAGTVVEWTEDFGMLRNRARHFQSVAERYGVRIRVRPANVESLDSMARGNPAKHVKIKSKTINGMDEVLGAPQDSQGLVGYFDPKTVTRSAEQQADFARVLGRQPTDADWAKLEKRFQQRADEFRDQAEAMSHLEHDGLIRRENGLVVDTGLSNTRLQNGELVHGTGPRTGTGRPFSGDHDMWDITRPDGSPVDAATKARVEANLMDGTAATQHGPHKDWKPATDVDKGIDARIRSSHGGQVNPDGSVTPRTSEFRNPDGTVDRVTGEALVEFKPGDRPRVSYETGQ